MTENEKFLFNKILMEKFKSKKPNYRIHELALLAEDAGNCYQILLFEEISDEEKQIAFEGLLQDAGFCFTYADYYANDDEIIKLIFDKFKDHYMFYYRSKDIIKVFGKFLNSEELENIVRYVVTCNDITKVYMLKNYREYLSEYQYDMLEGAILAYEMAGK